MIAGLFAKIRSRWLSGHLSRRRALSDWLCFSMCATASAVNRRERQVFNMQPYVRCGVFTRLQNRAVFQTTCVVAGSVKWPGELALSYDAIYLGSQPIASAVPESGNTA